MNIGELVSDFDVANAVATAVAPAILVSACVIFISALQTKFSNLVDRIRTLDREILRVERTRKVTKRAMKWLQTSEVQVDILLQRCRLVRDAIFIVYLSMFLLVLSVLVAALGIMIKVNLGWVTYIMFFVSVISIAVAVIQATREVYLSFRVIDEEVANAREISPLRESPGDDDTDPSQQDTNSIVAG